nr:putative glycosyltransferase - possibly involved in cell wall localization and side chain formation of rhamnose-glucose polysaccharide [Rhizobiaceae bacterium]
MELPYRHPETKGQFSIRSSLPVRHLTDRPDLPVVEMAHHANAFNFHLGQSRHSILPIWKKAEP